MPMKMVCMNFESYIAKYTNEIYFLIYYHTARGLFSRNRWVHMREEKAHGAAW